MAHQPAISFSNSVHFLSIAPVGAHLTFGDMYRIIAHFLQKTSFSTVFISSSNIFARWVIANNHYLDKRPRINLIELGIPFVTLFLALKYGAFLRRQITIRKMRWCWLFGTLFFGSLFFLATPSFLDRVNWGVVDYAFSWPVSWDYVLEGIGEFYPHVVIYWMPLAGLLSLAAFIASFTPINTYEELAEHGVAPNRSLPPSLNSTSSVRGSEDF